jgi:hypothetical protein
VSLSSLFLQVVSSGLRRSRELFIRFILRITTISEKYRQLVRKYSIIVWQGKIKKLSLFKFDLPQEGKSDGFKLSLFLNSSINTEYFF